MKTMKVSNDARNRSLHLWLDGEQTDPIALQENSGSIRPVSSDLLGVAA